MSGLDKMKAQIIAEAQENAKEILAQAHAQADSIIGEAKVQAEKDARKIIAQAEARAEDSVKRLASSSDMRKRKAVLEAKQEVIREVLEDAYKAVGELDDAAYFAMLEKVLEKYVLPEAGTICFTEKDRKRMPQGYMKIFDTHKRMFVTDVRGIWKKYMKQRRRKAEAWNLQRQCRKEWMGDLS